MESKGFKKKMANEKFFTFEVTIPADSYKYYDFSTNKDTDDYVPFRSFTIINTGSEAVKVYINDASNYFYVPSGVIFEKNNLQIYKMKIVNPSTDNPAELRLTIDNELREIDYLKMLVYGIKEVRK